MKINNVGMLELTPSFTELTPSFTGCDKKMKNDFPDNKSILNYWMDSGYAHFILSAQGGLLKINDLVTIWQHEMMLYVGKPYFARASSDGVYPRGRYVMGIYDFLTMHDPNPDYLYTTQFCQFMTVNKPSPFTGNKP